MNIVFFQLCRESNTVANVEKSYSLGTQEELEILLSMAIKMLTFWNLVD
jgi:hypothetical protein